MIKDNYNKMKIIKSILLLFIILIIFSGSSCDKKISVSPVEPPPSNGMLVVKTNPPGSQIYLDNKNTGYITPDTISWLDQKAYSLKLKREYFKDVTATVNVKDDSLSSYFFDYITDPKMRGSLNCRSNPPGALISLNDSSTGKITPITIEGLFPGNYNIKFSLVNHRDALVSINVESGMQKYVDGNLIDTTTWVTFNSQNSGIQSNLLNKVAIENGYKIWIGSTDGLIEYDGINFTLYNTNNSGLPDNGVFDIFIDNQGNKWICTFAGLAKFDNISWTVYDVTNSNIPSDQINCVTVAGNNDVWVGTFNKGLGKFDGNSWQVFNISNSGLPSNSISALASDQIGNLWIGTIGSGIVKYSNNNWTVYNNANSGLPQSDNVKDIKIKPDGTVWAAFSLIGISSPGGTAFFNGSLWTSFNDPSIYSTSISFGLDGLVWIGTSGDGFASYDGSVFKYFKKSTYPLPSNNTISIAIDNQGNKWLATNDAGLLKYKGN